MNKFKKVKEKLIENKVEINESALLELASYSKTHYSIDTLVGIYKGILATMKLKKNAQD